MKKNYIATGLIGIIAFIAIFTNPGQDRHKEAVKAKLNTYLQKYIQKNTSEMAENWGKAGQVLGSMLGGALLDQLTNHLVSTNNYILFSTTNITWEGQTKTIGFGAFGNVYLSDKIDEAIEKSITKAL